MTALLLSKSTVLWFSAKSSNICEDVWNRNMICCPFASIIMPSRSSVFGLHYPGNSDGIPTATAPSSEFPRHQKNLTATIFTRQSKYHPSEEDHDYCNSFEDGAPPPLAAIPSYDGSGSYPPPMGYGMEAVPPPSSYAGGPPSYGGPTRGYGGDAPSTGGRGGRGGGYDGGSAPRRQEPSYGDAPAEKVKQCDENCDETRDNTSIYINNLPPDVTTDELKDLFGGIGQIYTDEKEKNKGDACLAYEDPSAAHSAGGFFITFLTDRVQWSEKTPLAKKSLNIPLVLAYGHYSYKQGPVPRS
ncbi:Nucleotide-binding alpha-beta plait domain protein [Raphanus sativus]|nr:Nucleotide-binding alpha-beta plait domain protein [Raphanus sativus]